ncbi:hypothetical protein E3N88_27498 [Mikania micrantha]|uniref:Uncharacterized protein n=1 Tax=Mikania micrantha TaxID=192012 RepID=A0A5N6MXZ4_9ASTR|nr:hypothetical protein E3N88_27498 [Mikania micrantha]
MPTTTDSPPPKRHHKSSPSSSDEIQDTACSKRLKEEEEDDEKEELVEVPDDVLYLELDEYEFRNGVNPVGDHDHMLRYCLPWIRVGVGNVAGWRTKIRRLKNKFKNQSGPFDPYEEEEFLLWKKLFARAPPPDAGSRVS